MISLQYLFICTSFSLFNLQSLLLNDFKLFSKIYHRVPERKHEKDASCWNVSMNNKQEVVFLKATRTLAVIIKRLKLRRNTVNKKAYSSKKKKEEIKMEITWSTVAWELMVTLFCSGRPVEAGDCPPSIFSFSWK